MFFQVKITPEKKPKVLKPVVEAREEISQLSLALFTQTPKLFFEDVKLGAVAKQKLNIKNPSKIDIELFITKASPEERGVTFNWEQCTIPAEGETILEIAWSPSESGTWRDMLTLEDGHRIRKDIPIAFKCVSPKKPFKRTNKVNPMNSKLLEKKFTKKKRSPSKLVPRWKTSPVKKLTSPRSKRSPRIKRMPLQPNILPDIVVEPPIRRQTYNIGDKENILPAPNIQSNSYLSPNSLNYITEINNRSITLNQSVNLQNKTSNSSASFEDSLEMMSPNNSPHVPLQCAQSIQTKLQGMELTPVMQTCFFPSCCSTGEKSVEGNHTFDIQNTFNVSGGTYVKGNISGETYVKGNLSGGTYVKGNSSSGTYVLDESDVSPCCFVESPIHAYEKRLAKPTSLFQSSREFKSPDAPTSPLETWVLNKRPLEKIFEESLQNTDSESTPHMSCRKRKSEMTHAMSPSKRPSLQPRNSWAPRTTGATIKQKFSKGLNLKEFIEKSRARNVEYKEKSVALHDPDAFLNEISNPYVLATTNDIDPFMSATLYYEPKWIDEQETRFKKWMNALLTPPEELTSNAESHPVDVAKLWQECKKHDVSRAPTKEEMSSKFHVSSLLDALRNNAVKLFRSREVSQVLSKCSMMVENGKFSIRTDRDIHLDLGLQYEIMTLVLSYNPLWLRIGLETIFGKTIPLSSNSDLMGLSSFVMKNFFKDSYLLAKHKIVHSLKYSVDIKKHILKKFLMLVYFLDCAKESRLIHYDPCLFCKNAPYKESRQLILKFSSEVLSAVGDITKCLRLIGCVLVHKQTYIHEYDYAIENLGKDLRDGVRLTRIMEVILLKNDLVKCLRVPAISRLQKIHNLKIVFDSLTQANYKILHDITAKDIVDGHKEKTLSFLWQIIYKFQAPRFVKAVVCVQNWWRSLGIIIKCRINERIRKNRHNAALRIQKWYKRQIYRIALERFLPMLSKYLLHMKQQRAATVIQATYRMYKQRMVYKHILTTVIAMQSYARKWLVIYNMQEKINAIVVLQASIRCYIVRKRFLELKRATIYLEEKYLATKLMKQDLERFQLYKLNIIFMQRKFRANVLMKRCTEEYCKVKSAVLLIQRKYRATKLMQHQKHAYNCLREATLVVQSRYRANKIMKQQQGKYNQLRVAAMFVQAKFRALKIMQYHQDNYLKQIHAVIVIQRKYRAVKEMQQQKVIYNEIRSAVIIIQRKYRALKMMRYERSAYIHKKNSVTHIQRKYRALKAMQVQRCQFISLKLAAIVIQQKYRALMMMRNCRSLYVHKRNSVIYIQRKYRAMKAMQTQRGLFNKQKQAVLIIQRKYRALKAMQMQRNRFRNLKQAAIVIQRKYQALKIMQHYRTLYVRERSLVIYIQRKYRALKAMHKQRNKFKELKQAANVFQRKFRALTAMRLQRASYVKQRESIIIIQQKFRALKLMQIERSIYLNQRKSVIYLQRKYIAVKAMQSQRHIYNRLKQAVLLIQRKFRALQSMRCERSLYIRKRNSVVLLQSKFRALKSMRTQKRAYYEQRQAAICIQVHFRAYMSMKRERSVFNELKHATATIQNRFRALKLMQRDRSYYIDLIKSAIFVQRKFRALKAMQLQRNEYQHQRRAAMVIQSRYRDYKLMVHSRDCYKQKQEAVLCIQRHYRAFKLMQREQFLYTQQRQMIIIVQRRFRALKAMQLQRGIYEEQKHAAVCIQRRYRANAVMKLQRDLYQRKRKATLIIQRQYRANKLMEHYKLTYIKHRNLIILVQQKFKALIAMRLERSEYARIKQAVVLIQHKFSALRDMRLQRCEYLNQRNAVVVLQTRYRALKEMQHQKMSYLNLKRAVTVVQRKFRANTEMRRVLREYTQLQETVLTVQRRFRANQIMKCQRQIFINQKKSVVIIQRRYKAIKAMKEQRQKYLVLRKITIRIQELFRAKRLASKARDNYLELIKTVVFVQRKFRANKLMKDCWNNYNQIKNAALIIQVKYRAVLVMQVWRSKFVALRKSAVFVQRKYRANKVMEQTRSLFMTQKQSVLTLQRRFRAHKLMRHYRRQYIQLRSAVITMQMIFRANTLMRRYRDDYQNLKQATIRIQRFYRGYVQMKIESVIRKTTLAAILKLQAHSRGYMARVRCKELMDPELVKQRKLNIVRKNSATKIQACWRGFNTRRSQSPKFTVIRKRYKLAVQNKNPEKTLAHRKEEALTMLSTESSTFLQIIRALEDIEYVTRFCKETCLDMSNTLAEEVAHIIKFSGRSLPDMRVCTVAASILINFYKYPPSSHNAWLPEHIEDIIVIMTHWCDKEEPVFPHLCTLVWLYTHDKRQLKVLQALPKIRLQMAKMQTMCERKQKMVMRGTIKGASRFAPYKSLPEPSLIPDWGLEYKDKPRIFNNSGHALKLLVQALKLD